jgi:hypothetical protein
VAQFPSFMALVNWVKAVLGEDPVAQPVEMTLRIKRQKTKENLLIYTSLPPAAFPADQGGASSYSLRDPAIPP